MHMISIMKKSRVFSGFSKDECVDICQIVKPRLLHLKKGQIVLDEAETVYNIYVISKGKITGIKFYYEGNTHLMRTYLEGEAFGVDTFSSTFETSPLTYISDDDSEILAFPLKKVFDSLKNEHRERLLRNMLHVMADDNIKLTYKTEVLSKRMLRDRIMTYLLIIEKKKGRSSFRIMMNQDQFAQYLCVNRSALSYELNLMKKEGLITFKKDFFQIIK